ncbi:hypothetical protein TIFTF001_013706, partial [Ficus carica]
HKVIDSENRIDAKVRSSCET